MDDSISPAGASDTLKHNAEVPVPIDTLAIGEDRPEVGDPVTFRAGGDVTRVVNATAYVRLTTINDQPFTAPIVEPNAAVSEEERLRQLSESIDRDNL